MRSLLQWHKPACSLTAAALILAVGCSGGGTPAGPSGNKPSSATLQLIQYEGEPVDLSVRIIFPSVQPGSNANPAELITQAFLPNTKSLTLTLTGTVLTSSRVVTIDNNQYASCTMAPGTTCQLGPQASPALANVFTSLRPTTGYSIKVQGFDNFGGIGNKKYHAEVNDFSLAKGTQYCPAGTYPNCLISITMHLLFLSGRVIY